LESFQCWRRMLHSTKARCRDPVAIQGYAIPPSRQGLRASSMMLQRRAREFRSRVRYLHDTVTARHASTTKSEVTTVRIQARWRMASAVFSYHSVRVCTIVLQALCRGFVARQYCIRLRLGPPLNQKLSNDSIFQTDRQDRDAVMIQSGWKGAASRRECDALVKCVVMIPSSYLYHRCNSHPEKSSGTFLPHLLHSVSCLRCDASNIDQRRDCATAV
jgi:hypothetical protein